MQRTYDPRKARSNRSYTLKQVAALYDVNVATVRGWTRNGLELLDDNRPYMVYGPVLRKFHEDRQAARKWPKALDTLPCFFCSGPRQVKKGTFEIIETNTVKIRLQGVCVQCGNTIGRGDVRQNIAKLERRFKNEKPSKALASSSLKKVGGGS